MKKMMALAALVAATGAASAAQTYNDAVGDLFDNSFGHLDIRSVTLSNTATTLSITLNLNGNVSATTWGKYLFMFDINGNASGRADNPWGRSINTNGRLNDAFIGSWVDQNPDSFAQTWRDTGGWNQTNTVAIDRSLAAIGTIKYTINLADLGMVANGSTIYFDVMTTGDVGNPPGVDHLSVAGPATPGWGTESTAGNYVAYTLIPSPGTLALVGLGGLVAGRRRR
ncbi:MAG: PEP-CTERM sorting domain-containing protein [Planctomycetota bacterium]|nr:PEP-CTERM sorting domain-containing protein [Planctomycetota bacterium]